MTQVPEVGQQAPDFDLKSHTDQSFSLSSVVGSNIVIAFFPLAWTPV